MYSVLVNGSPTSPIAASRGLRQGDPLSPFIFIMVSGSLNRLAGKGRELGIVKEFEVSPNGPVVTHLQFADDTFFVTQQIRGFRLSTSPSIFCVNVRPSNQLRKEYPNRS